MHRTLRAAVQVLSLVVMVAGHAVVGAATASAGAASPTLEELKNATYQGIEGTAVTLANGRWEGAPYESGGAVRPSANLVRDYVTYGNFDGDADDEAVVFVNWSGGGTGQLLHLAVVERDGDAVRNVATALIGDRVQIRDTRIADGQIVVDVVRAGEKDAMCCPGELATLSFALGKDGLAKVRDEATGRLTLDTIGGGEWVLRSWTFWEPAPAEPAVTLSYADGRLAGTGGCNRYFADAKAADMPGDLTLGRPGSTRMACPDPLMQVEDRFLKQLAGVNKFGFMAGQLMLGYQLDGAYGVMLFDRRAPDAAATP
jgi:heat shock protein HslJ